MSAGDKSAVHLMEQSADKPGRQLAYMKQLDALRGVAIVAVLIEHFLPEDHFLRGLPWGGMGVQLFFVLSGYLITLILLDGRAAVTAGQDQWHILRNFYARRFLRIFPIYYLVLGVTALLGVVVVRQLFSWVFTYMSNVYFVFNGPREMVFHLWSLAVEEQFYLIWPWLILLLPRAALLPVILTAIIAAPLTRFFMIRNGFP